MKAGTYFQSIARTVPRGAVVLRPQSGILQRWQSAAAPTAIAQVTPEVQPRRPSAALSQQEAEPPAMPAEPVPLQSTAPFVRETDRFREAFASYRPAQAGVSSDSESAPLAGEVPAQHLKSTPAGPSTPLAFSGSHRAKATGSAPLSPSSPPGAERAPAEPSISPLSGSASPASASAAATTNIRREIASPGPAVAAAQREDRLPPSATKARPAIHIGAIEIHVVPPSAPPPAAAPRGANQKAPLSRGYLSRFGWDQA